MIASTQYISCVGVEYGCTDGSRSLATAEGVKMRVSVFSTEFVIAPEYVLAPECVLTMKSVLSILSDSALSPTHFESS